MVTFLQGLDGLGSGQFQAGPELIAFHPGRFPQLGQAGPLGLALSLRASTPQPLLELHDAAGLLVELSLLFGPLRSGHRTSTQPPGEETKPEAEGHRGHHETSDLTQ